MLTINFVEAVLGKPIRSFVQSSCNRTNLTNRRFRPLTVVDRNHSATCHALSATITKPILCHSFILSTPTIFQFTSDNQRSVRWSSSTTSINPTTTTTTTTTNVDDNLLESANTNITNTADISQENLLEGLTKEDERMITMLMEYQKEHGDCHVPTGKSDFAASERQRLQVAPELVDWVKKQRQRYQRHKGQTIQAGQVGGEKRKKNYKRTPKQDAVLVLVLESMGFMWSDREAQWQRAFNRLEAYKAQHGTLDVDREQDPQLWNWVDMQRKGYAKGKMSEDRVRLLNEIGFILEPHEVAWQHHYEKLLRYVEEHGDARVPILYEQDPSLGTWIARQRTQYHSGQLSPKRIEALEEVGFSWDVHGDTWEQFYSELVEFHSKHGHTRVPREMNRLWVWANRQRRYLRKRAQSQNGSPLDKERYQALSRVQFDWEEETEGRAKRLMDLPFHVELFDERWTENFNKLCAFKEKFGHFVIPADHPGYQELSNWVKHQRFLNKRGQLPADRVATLNGIGFAWTAHVARWDIMFEKLVRFRAEHGHAKVPVRNAELYRWVHQQRKVLRQHKFGGNLTGPKGAADHRMLSLAKILD